MQLKSVGNRDGMWSILALFLKMLDVVGMIPRAESSGPARPFILNPQSTVESNHDDGLRSWPSSDTTVSPQDAKARQCTNRRPAKTRLRGALTPLSRGISRGNTPSPITPTSPPILGWAAWI